MDPSERIDRLIAGLTDWRGKTFASIRKSILEADREIIEEWKWMGSPVWSHDGMIAVGNAHKGKLHGIFVGVADRDHSVVRPHWASHLLRFLDDLPVGLLDVFSYAVVRFVTPFCVCFD